MHELINTSQWISNNYINDKKKKKYCFTRGNMKKHIPVT